MCNTLITQTRKTFATIKTSWKVVKALLSNKIISTEKIATVGGNKIIKL